jgi:hypothetical protein
VNEPMALWFNLRANGDVIGAFTAIRRDSLIPADRICTYDVEISIHGRRSDRVVRHNYDAGAWALIAAALADYTREST